MTNGGTSANKIITIERYISEQQQVHPAATGVLTGLLQDLALSAKIIASRTTKAGLANILGSTGEQNVQGETVQKLDRFAEYTIFRLNDHTGRLAAMASEEEEEIIPIPDHYETGKYVLLYDPLDGSSNIDYNVSIGTIFGIYRRKTEEGPGMLVDVLQKAEDLVAAGYIVYGSSTMMVYSTGQGVHGFTLDPAIGEFFLSHPDIRIPAKPKYYSVNQGYEQYWSAGMKRFASGCRGMKKGKRCASRSRCATSARWWRIFTATCWRAASSATRRTAKSRRCPRASCACSTRPGRSAFWPCRPAAPRRTVAARFCRLSRRRCTSARRSSSAAEIWWRRQSTF